MILKFEKRTTTSTKNETITTMKFKSSNSSQRNSDHQIKTKDYS